MPSDLRQKYTFCETGNWLRSAHPFLDGASLAHPPGRFATIRKLGSRPKDIGSLRCRMTCSN